MKLLQRSDWSKFKVCNNGRILCQMNPDECNYMLQGTLIHFLVFCLDFHRKILAKPARVLFQETLDIIGNRMFVCLHPTSLQTKGEKDSSS